VCERIPYLILPVRQLSREPFSSRRSVRRSEPFAEAIRGSGRASRRARLDPNHPPKRYERAAGQAAWPVSSRSDTSEPSGKPLGPSRSEPWAEEIYASRLASRRACVEPSAEAPRASRRAVCRASLDPNHPPKRYERASGPVSSRSDTSEPSGKPPGPSRS